MSVENSKKPDALEFCSHGFFLDKCLLCLKNRGEEIEKINNDKLSKFEAIKNPRELFVFMTENVKYGIVDKNNKIYSPESDEWGIGDQPELIIQSPSEMIKNGYGMCWEQTELAKEWCESHGIECKAFVIFFDEQVNQTKPAHSFLAFKENNKWNWFETSLGDNNGIHQFNSLDDLIEVVKNKIINNALYNKATKDDIKKCKIVEFQKPQYGTSTQEYLEQIYNNSSLELN